VPTVITQKRYLGVGGKRQRVVLVFEQHYALFRRFLRHVLRKLQRFLLGLALEVYVVGFKTATRNGVAFARAEELIHILAHRIHYARHGYHNCQQYSGYDRNDRYQLVLSA
jgi:hypothetical protein